MFVPDEVHRSVCKATVKVSRLADNDVEDFWDSAGTPQRNKEQQFEY